MTFEMRRIGLVLSAGGSVGYAYHVGVLAGIEQELGWDPREAEVVVGTSAGSIVAAMLRAGFSAGDLAARSMGRPLSAEGRRLATKLGRPGGIPARAPREGRPRAASSILLAQALRHPFTINPIALAAAALPPGRVPTEPVVAGIRSLFAARWPAAATWICAVDIDTGRRVVFGHAGEPAASVADAVAASCAIPAFFQPVEIEGHRYVDGGVHSVTNADLLAGLDLDLVIISSSMTSGADGVRLSIDAPLRAFGGLRVAREGRAIRRSGTSVRTFQPTLPVRSAMGIDPLSDAHRREITQLAREATITRIRTTGTWRELLPLRSA